MVPVELHGDDADAHRRRTFLVVSWQSAVTKGATIDCLFPAFCLDNNQATEQTASQLEMALVWSLQQMSAGRLFNHNHWGVTTTAAFPGPIAGRYRACWVGTKGDQAYLKKAFKLSGSWVSKNVCHACQAGPLNKYLHSAFKSCIPEGHLHSRQYVLHQLWLQCATQKHVSRIF